MDNKVMNIQKINLIWDKDNNISLSWKMLALASIVLVAVCLLTYAHCLSYGFTNYDDNSMITEKIDYLRNISNMPKAFVTDAWHTAREIELYRPLQSATYFIDAQLGDNIAFACHLSNLIIHILVCLVIFKLLYLMGMSIGYALAGSLIYATHYLFLHAVVWIPARGDLLLALFSFSSLLFLIKYTMSRKLKFLLLHMLIFFMALLSKETAVMLPIIYLLYLKMLSKRPLPAKAIFVSLTCYTIIVMCYLLLRINYVSSVEGNYRIANILLNWQMLPETVAKLVIPINFSTLPAYNIKATVIGLIITIGVSVLVIRYKYYNRLILFGILWFMMFMLPALLYWSKKLNYSYSYLDHRSYLIGFGILMIVLNIVSQLKLNINVLNVLCLSVLVYLSIVNYYYSPMYKSPTEYSEQAIKSNPNSSTAYFIRGVERLKNSNFNGALSDFTNVLSIDPNDEVALFNRSLLYMQSKQIDNALRDIDKLISINPNYNAEAYIIRGDIMTVNNNIVEACNDYKAAAKLEPKYLIKYGNCN